MCLFLCRRRKPYSKRRTSVERRLEIIKHLESSLGSFFWEESLSRASDEIIDNIIIDKIIEEDFIIEKKSKNCESD